MKDRKRRFETFSFYDRTGIEAHLKKMAEKGWMISEMTTLGWIYKRVEPESLTFAVSYYPKASEFDPEPTEGQNIYHDLSSRTGWQFVCSSAQMQVFCTTDDKPIPIETDPALEVEMIHRSAKKGFLLSYYILLAVGVLNGALFISRLLGDPIGVLASPTNLFTGVAWTMLMLLCGVELIGYYRWRSKALKAADRGEFVDTPNHAQFQKLVLAVVFIAFFYWLINVVAVGDTLMKWVSILMLLYFFGLIVIVNTVKQLLKRKKASRGTNFAITMTVDIVLAVVLMAGITFGTLYAVRNGIFQNEENYETYEFHGSTQILYQDELPLRVEDMLDVEYDGYIYQRRGDESVFLGQYDLSQRTRMDDKAGYDMPRLEYTIILIKMPFLYDICKEQLIADKDETNDRSVPEGYKRFYSEQDPAPWKAEEVYQLAYQDKLPLVLFNEDFLITQEAHKRFIDAGIAVNSLNAFYTDQLSTVENFIEHDIASGFLYRPIAEQMKDVTVLSCSPPLFIQSSLVWKEGFQKYAPMKQFIRYIQRSVFDGII